MAKPVAAMLCSILALQAPPVRGQDRAPAEPAPAEDVWPFPPPDPKSWWDDLRPKLPEAADPLGGRRLARGERPAPIDNGTEPNSYRLWGLPPLQTQVLRAGEMILEVWIRPSGSVRQSIVRVTVRRDGKAFVQVRAGLACCEPDIARRVGFDAETDPAPFRALPDHPMWNAPRDIRVSEAGAVDDAICVDGASYDLTLVTPGRSRALRRACDDAAIGEVADALEPLMRAALGHEARFDVLFPRGADYSGARSAYRALLAGGGKLTPAPAGAARPAAEQPQREETAADLSETAKAEIATTEAAFAAAVARDGAAAAFRDYMDPAEGRVFRGDGSPATGAAAIYALFGGLQAGAGQPPDKVRLTWKPTSVWAAASGDFGVSTGDWTRVWVDGSKTLTGRYVTVWRKDAAGRWKGLIDIGETDAPPAR